MMLEWEKTMPTWVQSLWYWMIQLLLVLVALGIYFAPVVYRRWKTFVYTPLYFSVYLFTSLKVDTVEKYVGSDVFAPWIEDEDEAEKFRKKTILTVTISAILDMVILPASVAFVWLLFLNSTQFAIALVALMLIQAYRFFTSVLTIHRYTSGKPQSRGWLAAFYVVAWITIAIAMLKVQQWATPLLAARNYTRIMWGVADVFWNFVVTGIFVALPTALITTLLLNRKVRHRNLDEHLSSNELQETISKSDVSTGTEAGNQS